MSFGRRLWMWSTMDHGLQSDHQSTIFLYLSIGMPENFQDIDFEDLEQQQAGFEGKCP
jgi:hypothetical protein